MNVCDVCSGTRTGRDKLQVAKGGDGEGAMKSGVVEIRTKVRTGAKVIQLMS